MSRESLTFVCQSCAALVRQPEEAGTDSRARRSGTYCRRCYGNGRFVEPRLTLEEMIRRVSDELRSRGMSTASMGAELAETMAGLERWRALEECGRLPSDIPTQRAPQLVVSRKSERR